jgi:hypothetical protein
LDYQNLSLNEDPQAYNYLSESDFANTLYLSAIKIYGERALYLKSEIGRLFPLPSSLDISANLTQKIIHRLSKACEFILEGVSGLKPAALFKDTQANLLKLIDTEKAILDYVWQNYSYGEVGSTIYAPKEITELDSLAQSYVDSFDLAQSKTLFVPFSQLPGWAQAKKYYLEASLTSYMLNEIAQDFEDLLPLPQISTPVKGTVQDEDTNNNVYQLLSGELTLYDFSLQKFVEFQIATTVTASGVTNQTLSLDIPKSLELISYSHASLTESDAFYILQTQTSTVISCTVRAHSDLFGHDVTVYSNYGQYTSTSINLSVPQPNPQNALAQKTLDELVRLVRYAENLQFNLSTMSAPLELTTSATMLVQAGKELSGVLYWIPVRWAQLSALPEYYLFSYPEYSSASTQPAPHALPLFDSTTGLVNKNSNSFLTISADIAYELGTPETWKDMIEYLRAQLLQRLAELGYR